MVKTSPLNSQKRDLGRQPPHEFGGHLQRSAGLLSWRSEILSDPNGAVEFHLMMFMDFSNISSRDITCTLYIPNHF